MISHRSSSRHRSLLIAGATVAAAVLLMGGCAVTRIKVSSELAKAAEPFQASPPQATHRLLIVGDSTAVGTGASGPAGSVAGLIGKAHPDWLIANRARNGAKFAEVLAQLQIDERYDTVLVMAGGNDVIRLTGADKLAAEVRETVSRAKRVAPTVVMMPSGNVGNAPFFYAPWSWLMSSRSRDLHATVRDAAAGGGAQYVNLYKERENDPFALEPDRMNAVDGLHPSDAGYQVWFDTLSAQARL